jgi:hypothetical protein
MKLKRTILILQVSFLLLTFGAATFYFQYASIKKNIESSTSKTPGKQKCTLPIAEEESGNEDSNEEEGQDEDRVFHEGGINIFSTDHTAITFATISILDFKEIHFEIVTPPPQV